MDFYRLKAQVTRVGLAASSGSGEAVDGDLYTWSGGAFVRHRSDFVFGLGALLFRQTEGQRWEKQLALQIQIASDRYAAKGIQIDTWKAQFGDACTNHPVLSNWICSNGPSKRWLLFTWRHLHIVQKLNFRTLGLLLNHRYQLRPFKSRGRARKRAMATSRFAQFCGFRRTLGAERQYTAVSSYQNGHLLELPQEFVWFFPTFWIFLELSWNLDALFLVVLVSPCFSEIQHCSIQDDDSAPGRQCHLILLAELCRCILQLATSCDQDQRVQRAPKYAELMSLMQSEVPCCGSMHVWGTWDQQGFCWFYKCVIVDLALCKDM